MQGSRTNEGEDNPHAFVATGAILVLQLAVVAVAFTYIKDATRINAVSEPSSGRPDHR